MAYTTVSKLTGLTADTLTTEDSILISSGDRSYKANLEDLKTFLERILEISSLVFENKVIDSITNTIHATALHFEGVAREDLQRGDVVTLFTPSNGEDDGFLPEVKKASRMNGPALGVVKDEFVPAGSNCAVMGGGIFTSPEFDTSEFEEGSILWLGLDGKFQAEKPGNTDGIHQACGFVLHSNETDGALMLSFQSIEPQGHDVAFAGFEYDLTATDVEHGIAEVFSLCDAELITVDHQIIENNQLSLDRAIYGDIVLNGIRIFDSIDGNSFDEFTGDIGQFYNTIDFDIEDELNGKFATLSYLSVKPKSWSDQIS